MFEESVGPSLIGWKLARWLYSRGASGGLIGRLYRTLRAERNYNNPSLFLSVLSRSIRQAFSQQDGFVVVAHPILVAGLRGVTDLSYQHGELVAPGESLVKGASRVFVPTGQVADSFIRAGYRPDQVIVTGLCIEPSLVKQAENVFKTRVDRINRREPLTGLFVSSGAEPPRHVNLIIAAATSAVESGNRLIVICRRNGRLMQKATAAFIDRGIDCAVIDSTDVLPTELPQVVIASHQSRREETIFTSRLFPYYDYFVAPSHERTNWALGLGLPMFVIGPCIGPFAPKNRQLLLDHRVAVPIDSIAEGQVFGATLRDMRQTGHLSEMAFEGWCKFPIDGFDKIADFLVALVDRPQT